MKSERLCFIVTESIPSLLFSFAAYMTDMRTRLLQLD
jgi:hypothetical protein